MLELEGQGLSRPVLGDASVSARQSVRPRRERLFAPRIPDFADWRTLPASVTPLVHDAAADERLLAWVRLGASSALLLRLVTDAGPGHSQAVQALTTAYVTYSGLLLLASWLRSDWVLRRVNAIHAIDFGWTTVASTMGGGTGSHAFVYFAFVLAAAAFRWDLRRTLLNGAFVLVVGILQSVAALAGLTPWAFEFDEFLVRVSLIACGMAALFGILADRLHRARHQATAIAAVVSSVARATRLREAVSATLSSIASVLDASRVVVVAEDTHTGTATVWQAIRDRKAITTSQTNLAALHAAAWLRAPGAGQWPSEVRRKGPGHESIVTLSVPVQELHRTTWLPLAPAVQSVSNWRTLLALPFSGSGAWTGQMYVMDPAGSPHGEIRLRFVADIVRQITPGLVNVYLLRRLRTRAESLERGRISRELHDTANQSLAAIDMRLDLLRRKAQGSPSTADDLREIQRLVRTLTLDIRQFVAKRHEHLDCEGLPGALEDLVDRVCRESEIDAKLDWAVTGLRLPPRHCTELARIVQEALFNVRRHSGASRALVRVESDAGGLAVIVEDNGRGMGFTGRLTADDPEFQRRAPRVIRERALAIGGTLAIESSGTGTRLEITFSPTEHR